MSESIAHTLLNDPGVIQAKALLEELHRKGVEVFYSPTSLMITGADKQSLPSCSSMDEVFPLHHEIGLLFALQTISKHYSSMGMISEMISGMQHEAAKS